MNVSANTTIFESRLGFIPSKDTGPIEHEPNKLNIMNPQKSSRLNMVLFAGMIRCKYKWFGIKVIHLGLATLFVLLSSCGSTTNTITYPLSEPTFKDTRFLDTIQEKTTFYFGIINPDGYDRFGGTVFEDLQRKITLRNSVSDSPKRIDYFFGEVQSKGLNTVFIVNGVYVNEPNLFKVKNDSVSSIVSVQEVVKTNTKNTPPDAAAVLIQAKKDLKPKSPKVEEVTAQPEKVKQDDRLIIVACFKEEYFQEYMLEPYYNELADIGYYKAKGWVRVYLVDFPGFRIWEAKEVFPDAWRTYYGE
jgi:hypothetical protein